VCVRARALACGIVCTLIYRVTIASKLFKVNYLF